MLSIDANSFSEYILSSKLVEFSLSEKKYIYSGIIPRHPMSFYNRIKVTKLCKY